MPATTRYLDHSATTPVLMCNNEPVRDVICNVRHAFPHGHSKFTGGSCVDYRGLRTKLCLILSTASSKMLGRLRNTNLDDEKDFKDDYREEFTDFVQSIPGFQECNEEDVETWMTCDAEDCGFQMLNDEEIVTSVLEESDPVDDETDEDEDNNSNESSKGPSNADAFSAFKTAMEWY
ncbi:uncharacterized protein TNCV_1249401 [Trichonephila clavipes]|nr:uncharacterized protein TNCV_1249401 [Trichonephila clavipes]